MTGWQNTRGRRSSRSATPRAREKAHLSDCSKKNASGKIVRTRSGDTDYSVTTSIALNKTMFPIKAPTISRQIVGISFAGPDLSKALVVASKKPVQEKALAGNDPSSFDGFDSGAQFGGLDEGGPSFQGNADHVMTDAGEDFDEMEVCNDDEAMHDSTQEEEVVMLDPDEDPRFQDRPVSGKIGRRVTGSHQDMELGVPEILVRCRDNNGWATTRGLNDDVVESFGEWATLWSQNEKLNKEYTRLARNTVDNVLEKCVCCVVKRKKRADCKLDLGSSSTEACGKCTGSRETTPCAVLVYYNDVVAMGFIPLPAEDREDKRWEEMGYWWKR
jgi:hypothetical protein